MAENVARTPFFLCLGFGNRVPYGPAKAVGRGIANIGENRNRAGPKARKPYAKARAFKMA
jgi:hypothetical protein